VLTYRLMSGVLAGGALLLLLWFLPAVVVFTVVLLLGLGGQAEFYRMLRRAEIPVFTVVGALAGGGLLTVTFFALGPLGRGAEVARELEWAILLATLLAVFLRVFPQKHNPRPLETMGCTLLGVWYVPFLLNFVTALGYTWEQGGWGPLPETGRWLILYLVAVVKCSDIGAYAVGMLVGRHKLIPRISPNKTWEGFVGGIVFSLIASCAFSILCHGALGKVPLTLTHALVLGPLLGLVGVAGDLFESLMKRASHTKDSGAIVPGMGGLLDVLDSLLFGAPVLYAYVRIVLL
jgi:phosphatidate cytidylyltransferase